MLAGVTIKHLIFSLNVDTGATRSGWPVDVNAKARYDGLSFTSLIQNQRGALGLLNGVVYVPYSGHSGDCRTYRGWVVGVPISNPSTVTAWATSAIGGGIWGHGGVASGGTNMFVITGNTFQTGGHWGGGEAVIRLQPGPVFSGNPIDSWAPTNCLQLDNGDTDLGGCGPVVITIMARRPPNWCLHWAKMAEPICLTESISAALERRLRLRKWLLLFEDKRLPAIAPGRAHILFFALPAALFPPYRITATNPPTIVPAWNVSQNGQGSPWVATTNGTDNAIVWAANSGNGDQRVRGFNGDTGAVVYAGGGSNELMSGTSKYNTGIVARGRMYFAGTNKVYAFALP